MKSSSVSFSCLSKAYGEVTDNELQSCSGLSFKSQVLYLIVFVTRYLGESPYYIRRSHALIVGLGYRPFLELHGLDV